jgi:hypothetical protein
LGNKYCAERGEQSTEVFSLLELGVGVVHWVPKNGPGRDFQGNGNLSSSLFIWRWQADYWYLNCKCGRMKMSHPPFLQWMNEGVVCM